MKPIAGNMQAASRGTSSPPNEAGEPGHGGGERAPSTDRRRVQHDDQAVELMLAWIDERIREIEREEIRLARHALDDADRDMVAGNVLIRGTGAERILRFIDLAGDALGQALALNETATAALTSARRILLSV